MQFECKSLGIAAIMCGLIVRPPSMSRFCCVIFDVVWRLRKEKAEEEEQVQRVQEENGELR